MSINKIPKINPAEKTASRARQTSRSPCEIPLKAGIILISVLLAAALLTGCAAAASLQQQITNAPDGGTVTLDKDYEENIVISGKTLTLDLYSHTLEADNEDLPTISVEGDAVLTVKDTIGTGKITGGDSGIWIKIGKVTLESGTITENEAGKRGGGVLVENGCEFTMNGGSITGNEARFGAGVYVDSGKFTLNDGLISENETYTDGHGGGVYLTGGEFIMNSGMISGNWADDFGGGVSIENEGTFTMTGGIISGNEADDYDGGGVYVADGEFTMGRGSISGNEADEDGGGVCIRNGNFIMNGGTISGNETNSYALNGGGGVCVDGGSFTMNGGTITENNAGSGNGGGVCVHRGKFTLIDGKIINNEGQVFGGGVNIGKKDDHSAEFIMTGGVIDGNVVNCYGGGVCVLGKAEISGGTISKNTAGKILTGCGGGIYVAESCTLTMKGSIVSQNYINRGFAGGIFVCGTINVSGNVTVTGNIDDDGECNTYLEEDSQFILTGPLTGEIRIIKCRTTGVRSADSYIPTADDLGRIKMDDGTAAGSSAVYNSDSVYHYAKIEFKPAYQVTFDWGHQGTPAAQRIVSGGLAAMPKAPEDPSCLFNGWYKDKDCTQPWNFTTDKVNSAVTLYGNGEEQIYNLLKYHYETFTTKTIVGSSSPFHSKAEYSFADNKLTLTDDVTRFQGVIEIIPQDGPLTNGEVRPPFTIDLNGHVLDFSLVGGHSPITVTNGGRLIITDSNPSKKHYFTYESSEQTYKWTPSASSGDLEVSGGCLTGGRESNQKGGGGVLVANGGSFTFSGGNIVGNRSTANVGEGGNGGAVYVEEGAAFILDGGTVIGNTAGNNGGGVYSKGTFTQTGGSVSKNRAVNGGGVYIAASNDTASYTLTGGTVAGNTAGNNGGGVYNTGSFAMSAPDSRLPAVSGNTAGGNGGGVYNTGTFDISEGTVSNNSALNGGGVYTSGRFTMSAGTVSSNSAVGSQSTESGSGGGVFIAENGEFVFTGGQITENSVLKSSSSGGGVFVWLSGKFTMSGTAQITKNHSAGYGGGVMVYTGGTFTLSDSGVIGSAVTSDDANTAAYGAGVFVENGDFTMTGGTIGYNHASAYFGGVSFYNESTTDHTFDMSGGIITMNSSEMDPSALTDAQGVAIGCSDDACKKTRFKMSGSASIPESNTIYLAHGLYINVTGPFTSDAAGAKSLLFDEQYPDGKTVAVVSGSAKADDTLSYLALSSLYEPFGDYKLIADQQQIIVLNKNMVTVTFNSNGGSDVPSQLVMTGEKAVKPADPTREGYKFAGWFTDTGLTMQYDFSTPVTEDFTLYAKWNAKQWEVTYSADEGTSGSVPVDSNKYADGDSVTVRGPEELTKEEYYFNGWIASTNGKIYDEGSTYYIYSDVTFTAVWEAEEKYALAYNANGATSGTVPETKQHSTGESVTVSGNTGNLKKTGYHLKTDENGKIEWKTNSAGSGETYVEGNSFSMPANPLLLYAVWEKNTYTITYHKNDESQETTEQARTYDDGNGLSENTFTRGGYTFSGWNTKSDGSGKTYQPGYTGNLITDAEPTVDLYALWTAKTYTIHFDANGGAGTMEDKTDCLYNTNIQLTKNTFEKPGYTFSGWIDPTSPFKPIPDEGPVNFREDQVTENKVTLKALWTATICTVSFYKEKDDTEPYLTVKAPYNSPITKPYDPEKPGYTFNKWCKADGTPWDFATPLTEDELSLYAQWKELSKYKVTYNKNGADEGDLPAELEVHEGTTVRVSGNTGNLKKTGYNFSCWNSQPEGTGIDYPEESMLTVKDNVTLYAKWIPAGEKTITIHTYGHGTITANKSSAVEGDTITLTVTPDKGYRLSSLYASPGTVKIGDDRTFTMPDEDVHIYGEFSPAPSPEPERRSSEQGSSTWLTEPIPIPTPTPTPAPIPVSVPTPAVPGVQPVETSGSGSHVPLGFILAGAGVLVFGAAAAIFFLRRR